MNKIWFILALAFSAQAEMVQLISDPSFEEGKTDNPYWSIQSANNHPVICSYSNCDQSAAYQGYYWAVFGGDINDSEYAELKQSVFIPETEQAELSFFLRIPYAGNDNKGFLSIWIDSQLIKEFEPGDINQYENYKQVNLDISDFADDLAHEIRFQYNAQCNDYYNYYYPPPSNKCRTTIYYIDEINLMIDQQIMPSMADPNQISNAGFENGHSSWSTNSNTGESVICTIESCGTSTGSPASGEGWARLGGQNPGDWTELKQMVRFDQYKQSKQSVELSFLLRIKAMQDNQQKLSLPLAGLNLSLNGVSLWNLSATEAPNYESYVQVPINISNLDPSQEYEFSFSSLIADLSDQKIDLPIEYDAVYFLIDNIEFKPKTWLKNGSFEQQAMDWQIEGDPICSIGDCDYTAGLGPHSGRSWARFGNDIGYNSLIQTVQLDPAASAELSFYLATPYADAQNYFRVLIDNKLLFQAENIQQVHYQLISLDLSAYADGLDHSLKFESRIYDSSVFLLDDIQIKLNEPMMVRDCEGDAVVIIGEIDQDYYCEAQSIRTVGEVQVQAKTRLKATEIQLSPLFQVKPGAELIIE